MTTFAEEPTIAAAYGIRLLRLLERWEVTESELLTGIDPDGTDSAGTMLSVARVVRVLERARLLTAEPGLGLFMALEARVSSHGFLGFAAMSAASLGDAINLAIRYQPIRGTAFSFRSEIGHGLAVLTVDERADFGSARDIVVLSLMFSLHQLANVLTGRELGLELELRLPRPDYFDRFERVMPPVRFSQPLNRLYGPGSLLDLPLVSANAEALALAQQQCESTLVSLGLDGSIGQRVRAVLSRENAAFNTLEAVANELGLSARTLRRKLDAEGAPFASLLADVRRERAMLWLRSRQLSVEDVAERLGYSNVGAFTRAFIRWTGQTPSAFRKAR